MAGLMPTRLPSLTGLRFVLAASVLAAHTMVDSAVFADDDLHTALLPMETYAACAVSGFFVLSGFVLTWTHRPGESARAFWRRRLWKIFPCHALGWAGAVLFFALTSAAALPDGTPVRCDPGSGFLTLFLMQNWTPVTALTACFNAPSWSISCEAFFYALFPLLITAVRALPAHRLRHAWTVLALTVVLLPLASLPLEQETMWISYLFPPPRLTEFVLGIVTARLIQTGRWPRLPRTALIAPAALAAALTPVMPEPYWYGAHGAVPLALLIAHLALVDSHDRTGRLAHPTLVTLGDASYALYIVHWPLLLAARHLIGSDRTFSTPTGLLLAVAFAVLAQATALLVHKHVERPLARRWSRPPDRKGKHTPSPSDAQTA
ncbi:acyltransferase family protein [Streptomyces scopuliridis]|uniref:acyltransferase family protein n=1 Tax=Streptomyces scopuliridis TaxID=452529 RepID=UPI0036C22721